MTNTTTGYRTVAGLFDSMQEAHRAVDELATLGVQRDDVSIIAGNESNRYADYSSGAGEVGKGVAGGAGAGAAIGGGLGLIAGLTALAIPGFGPIIAAGPIAAALTGAGVGAAAGGLIGGLTKAGVPESDAKLYEAGVRRGGVLVTVRANDAVAEEVADVLDANGARDIDDDGSSTAGYTSGQTMTGGQTFTGGQTVTGRGSAIDTTTGDRTIPVVEEELVVGKRETGRRAVRIYTDVEQRPVEETVTLREERVRVDRQATDRPATEADFTAFREGTIELTETREEPVVTKQARVVEEVVVGKEVEQHTETIRDTVRRTDVKVEEDVDTTRDNLSSTDKTRNRV